MLTHSYQIYASTNQGQWVWNPLQEKWVEISADHLPEKPDYRLLPTSQDGNPRQEWRVTAQRPNAPAVVQSLSVDPNRQLESLVKALRQHDTRSNLVLVIQAVPTSTAATSGA